MAGSFTRRFPSVRYASSLADLRLAAKRNSRATVCGNAGAERSESRAVSARDSAAIVTSVRLRTGPCNNAGKLGRERPPGRGRGHQGPATWGSLTPQFLHLSLIAHVKQAAKNAARSHWSASRFGASPEGLQRFTEASVMRSVCRSTRSMPSPKGAEGVRRGVPPPVPPPRPQAGGVTCQLPGERDDGTCG